MKVAILFPIRICCSGGFVKHIAEVAPRWLKCSRVERINILVTDVAINGIEKVGAEVHRVSRYDYWTGFRQMGKLVKTGGYDVVLCITARPVKLTHCPVVTMVRNIEPIQIPTYKMPLTWRLRLWKLRHEHAVACRQATRILTVSHHVRDEVCRRFRIRPEKTNVVYHGFDATETIVSRKPGLDIVEGFIFSVGSLVPYRGYEDIILSLAELRANSGKSPCVVLAGSGCGLAGDYERSLQRLARSLQVEDRIIWAGQLQRDELTWCYRNAKVFIQTSRAEACPNIVIEAMGHGCLIISCDHPPMPEFFGETAFYYPVGDVSVLARKIQRALDMGKEEAEIWRTKARQKASFFSWDNTAEQTLDVLERAIKEHRK